MYTCSSDHCSEVQLYFFYWKLYCNTIQSQRQLNQFANEWPLLTSLSRLQKQPQPFSGMCPALAWPSTSITLYTSGCWPTPIKRKTIFDMLRYANGWTMGQAHRQTVDRRTTGQPTKTSQSLSPLPGAGTTRTCLDNDNSITEMEIAAGIKIK